MKKKRWNPICDSGWKKIFFMMRITVFFLFAGLLQVSASAYSQQTILHLKAEKASVSEVLKMIEDQSDFHFLYRSDHFKEVPEVSINMQDAKLEDVLNKVIVPYGFSYEIDDRTVVIKRAAPAVFTEPAEQQQKVVEGSVKDENGQALPGATIIVKGTTIGITTDFEGKFRFKIPSDAKVLVFSFIGMKSQEITIAGKSTFDIVLQESATGIDEVVAVGYGINSRKNLTTAVSSIKSEEITKGAISDVGQLLQGKVPGLNITASGDPNRTAAVVLRGASTINSSQGPFYVIDGIPGADISIIATDDIASIDILKDAAATAIYGNRAANGVIMVTTKRGKIGQMQVTYNGNISVESVSNKLNLMDAPQLRSYLKANSLSFSPNDDLSASTDWQSAIERSSAISHNHNLSFSGGSEHNIYSASINYLDKQGILLNSGLKRVIARLSIEQKVFKDKLTFGINVSNSNSNATYVPLQNIVLQQMTKHLPVSPIMNADGSYFENFNTTGYFNPLAMMNHAQDKTKYNGLIGSFTTELKLPFGLSYNLNLSYQNLTSLHGEFYDSYYSNYPTSNFYNNPDPGIGVSHSLIGGLFGTNGSALRNTYQSTNKTLETFVTWNRRFNNHTIVAVVGYSYQGNIYGDGFQTSSTNFPADNIGYNNLSLGVPYAISSYRVNFGDDKIYQETKNISDFARLNYNFKDKYLLQSSIRRDGSSVFGTNNRWGYFPSVALAWRVNQEYFMKSQNIFSDLKLRASYGVTGNSSGFGAYTAKLIYGSTGTYYSNGAQVGAYGPIQGSNPDLKWERTATKNIGIDFAVLKGKVSGSVEVYDKSTSGMIFNYSVSQALVPGGKIWANGGSISNKGFEIVLNITPVSTKDLSWTSSINLAHNINKITSLINPITNAQDSIGYSDPEGKGQTGSTLQLLKKGVPLGQFFTLQYAGKDASGYSQFVAANGSLTTSPVIGKDYHLAGSAQPKVLMGWTNTVRYKNFDLSVFIRGVFGNKIFDATRADLFGVSTASTNNILQDAAGEKAADSKAGYYSTRFIEDGSYVRLDNATLSYNFKAISEEVKNIRLYISVNNLFTITKYKGIDPEINQGGVAPGIDYNNFYPKTRTVLFGVNITF